MRLHGTEVLTQRLERNFSPSAAVERERAAIRKNQSVEARSVHLGDYSDSGVVGMLTNQFRGEFAMQRGPLDAALQVAVNDLLMHAAKIEHPRI